ncbi:hypothetical protein HZS_3739 [Henneguya salminicola]|nr:hypothetical protein HZS_3739 [Henneguya salminicola]
MLDKPICFDNLPLVYSLLLCLIIYLAIILCSRIRFTKFNGRNYIVKISTFSIIYVVFVRFLYTIGVRYTKPNDIVKVSMKTWIGLQSGNYIKSVFHALILISSV